MASKYSDEKRCTKAREEKKTANEAKMKMKTAFLPHLTATNSKYPKTRTAIYSSGLGLWYTHTSALSQTSSSSSYTTYEQYACIIDGGFFSITELAESQQKTHAKNSK